MFYYVTKSTEKYITVKHDNTQYDNENVFIRKWSHIVTIQWLNNLKTILHSVNIDIETFT